MREELVPWPATFLWEMGTEMPQDVGRPTEVTALSSLNRWNRSWASLHSPGAAAILELGVRVGAAQGAFSVPCQLPGMKGPPASACDLRSHAAVYQVHSADRKLTLVGNQRRMARLVDG